MGKKNPFRKDLLEFSPLNLKPFRLVLGMLFELLDEKVVLALPPKQIASAILDFAELHKKHADKIKEYVRRYHDEGYDSNTWENSPQSQKD